MFNPNPKPSKSCKKKKQPIKSRSKKRAIQEREYSKKRKIYLSNNPICKFKGCLQIATTIHHKKGRIGSLLTDENYFIGLCMEHHHFIEVNPLFAKKNNYSESRLV